MHTPHQLDRGALIQVVNVVIDRSCRVNYLTLQYIALIVLIRQNDKWHADFSVIV